MFKRQNSVVEIWQLIGAPGSEGPLPWYNRHNGSSGTDGRDLSANVTRTFVKFQ